jgi:hypothetical protein
MSEKTGPPEAVLSFLYQTTNWLERLHNGQEFANTPEPKPASAQTSNSGVATVTPPPPSATEKGRPSKERVNDCLKSASHWVSELPNYADSQQRRADWFAICAGVVAAVTGASIYPVAENVTNTTARVLLAAPALLAAVLAVFPQVKNYGEMAGRARELSSSYGDMTGRLRDAVSNYDVTDTATLKTTLDDFGNLKAKKDQLRDLPPRRGT